MDGIMKITAMGYWFPIGRPDFFHAPDDDALIERAQSTFALQGQSGKEEENLQASVYQRLNIVALDKGYTQAIPVFPKIDRTFGDKGNEPVMVVLTRDAFDRTWGAFEQPWPASVRALVMIVHSRGLYLWLAVHDKSDEKGEEAVKEALQEHIYDIVGGAFVSRSAGDDDKPASATPNEDATNNKESLRIYRDRHLGILSFSQINTIFEGLNNSAFDPAVFFERLDDLTDNAKEEYMKRYSLGDLIRRITTLTAVGDDDPQNERSEQDTSSDSEHPQALQNSPQPVEQADRGFTTAEIASKLLALTAPSTNDDEKERIADQLRYDCLTSTVQHNLLRQFMRNTSISVLQTVKWRIERCSRALLAEMIEVTHRRQPLIQSEAPGYKDRIKGVNEAQLRGFIMYFAAKMPLLKNIERYLDEAMDEEDIREQKRATRSDAIREVKKTTASDDIREALWEDLETLRSGWVQLLHAIGDNIAGLEQAIVQARQDSLLREEERIRTEQETIAEITRLREGNQQQSLERTDQTVAIISNMFTLITVIPIIIILLQTSVIQFPPIVWPPNGQTFFAVSSVMLGFVALAFLYLIVHWVTFLLVRPFEGADSRESSGAASAITMR